MQSHFSKFWIIVAVTFSVPAGPAFASAGFSCHASDKNVESLIVEGATPRSGGMLINFGGIIEIEPGKKIEFEKANVTKFVWRKNLWINVRKKLGSGAFVEIKVRTHMNEEEEYFPGSYTVRTEKTKRSGQLSCSSD
jgi:hypothetical protein